MDFVLIWKTGRGYYLPNAEGYTFDVKEAGRFPRPFGEAEVARHHQPGVMEVRDVAGDLDLTLLRRIAEAAAKIAPGAWQFDGDDDRFDIYAFLPPDDLRSGGACVTLADTRNAWTGFNPLDRYWLASHMACFDPPTAQQLIQVALRHNARVAELHEANNREVERRRAARAEALAAAAKLVRDLAGTIDADAEHVTPQDALREAARWIEEAAAA